MEFHEPQLPSTDRFEREHHIEPSPPRHRNAKPLPSPRFNEDTISGNRKFFKLRRASSTPPEITRENATSDMSSSTTAGQSDVAWAEQERQRHKKSGKASQYFSEAFTDRGPSSVARERVQKESIVIVDVKLNRQLGLQQDFLRDLSFQISEIFLRTETSVMVMVTPDIQMVIGGSCEPAYHISITGLRSVFGPTKNKRTSHLVQDFMSETLRIKPCRGIIRFDGLGEENLATNGITMLQEIEDLKRSHDSEESGILRSISRQSHIKGKNTTLPISTVRGKTSSLSSQAMTRSNHNPSTTDSANVKREGIVDVLEPKKLKQRRSIMSIFRR